MAERGTWGRHMEFGATLDTHLCDLKQVTDLLLASLSVR